MNKEIRLLTPTELVERWGNIISQAGLTQWRVSKPQKGPKFIRIHGVKYPEHEIEKYERDNNMVPPAE
jgi:hypothetical protein